MLQVIQRFQSFFSSKPILSIDLGHPPLDWKLDGHQILVWKCDPTSVHSLTPSNYQWRFKLCMLSGINQVVLGLIIRQSLLVERGKRRIGWLKARPLQVGSSLLLRFGIPLYMIRSNGLWDAICSNMRLTSPFGPLWSGMCAKMIYIMRDCDPQGNVYPAPFLTKTL